MYEKKTKAQDVGDLWWLIISLLLSDRGDQELLVPTAKHFPLSSTAVWLQMMWWEIIPVKLRVYLQDVKYDYGIEYQGPISI